MPQLSLPKPQHADVASAFADDEPLWEEEIFAPSEPSPPWLKRKVDAPPPRQEDKRQKTPGGVPKAAPHKASPLNKAPGGVKKAPPAPPRAPPPTDIPLDIEEDVPEAAASDGFALEEAKARAKTAALVRKDTYRDFSDVDPLYALIGELGDKKVVSATGALDEERITEYVRRLMRPGVIKTNKQWVEVWAAMGIPIENQAQVTQIIIQVGLESDEVADKMADILSELVKGHRVKIKAVEEAIVTLFECGSDQSGCLSRFLLLIFPKSPTSEWGWSRVGWSWKEWWGTTEKICATLEPYSAFELLSELLQALEQDSGAYLPHQQIWDEKRLAMVRAALCQYGGFQEDELPSALGIDLGGEQPAG